MDSSRQSREMVTTLLVAQRGFDLGALFYRVGSILQNLFGRFSQLLVVFMIQGKDSELNHL